MCRRMHSRVGRWTGTPNPYANEPWRHTYSQMAKKTPFLVSTTIVQGSGAALSDKVISARLCWIFHKNKSEITKHFLNITSNYRTNSMINDLITYAINRAIATGVWPRCMLLTVLLVMFPIVHLRRLDVLLCNLFYLQAHRSQPVNTSANSQIPRSM
ncbi:hypothetical protein CPB83DRAFT_579373 [Crepidotus variabilis]|uniref:Uncharacterized protein n=1 Tax=Crepidotus variabilis TaxID=179855 RepID=A0A9P6JTS6_9AGAR|nr:hypothetical protein CPB83DRAFT_579373 [Crepidotus variabilis]